MSRHHVPAVVAACTIALLGCRRTASSPSADADAGNDAAAAMALALGTDAGSLTLDQVAGLGHSSDLGMPTIVIPAGTAAPLPAGTSTAAREKEMLDLLTGRLGPDALPSVPMDPDAGFDEGLRGRLMSPTRYQMGVSLSSIAASGALSEDTVARPVAAARPRLRACYRLAVANRPDLAGALRVRITVAPSGDVKAVETTPTVDADGDVGRDKSLRGCIEKTLGGMSFPGVDAGTSTVSFVATFSVSDDTALR